MTDFDVVDALAGFAEDLESEAAFAERLHAAVVKTKAAHDTERDAPEQSREIERLIGIIREVAPDRLEDKIWQDWKAEALALRAENAAMKEYIEYTKDLRRNI